MRRSARPILILFATLATLAVSVSPARASLIAVDTYAIGSDPGAGQYVAGTILKSQPASMVNTGFVNGGYGSGSGTSQFSALSTTSFGYAPFGSAASNAGLVNYGGAYLDGATRSNARNFTAAATAVAGGSTGTTLWFNILASSDGTSTLTGNNGTGNTVTVNNGSVLASIGNAVPPGYGSGTAGNYSGLAFGFASHSATDTNDLVIRYRSGVTTNADVTLVSGASGTYDIVARLDVNVNGTSTDKLTYWLNPTNFSSQASLDSSSQLTNDTSGALSTFASQGIPTGSNADFTRLTYSSTNWNGNANFGDVAFATTLGDISNALVSQSTAVPEPGSVIMVGVGMAGVLGLAIRRRARA